ARHQAQAVPDADAVITMSLSAEQVQWVANLARLELSDAERAAMADQLGRIIEHVNQLQQLDTEGVEPLAHALEIANVFRADAPQIRPFVSGNEEAAVGQARAIDARRRAAQPLGALAGLPVAVKDVICVRNERTTCGSRILADYRPPFDAHVITRLREADAIL